MTKVRRIDWSPDEYIAGTFGRLNMAEHGVYMVVLMQIYSRADACPNDVEFIASHFEWKRPHRKAEVAADAAPHKVTARALARLIELGKLQVSADGQWLTNGRAEVELNRARERIVGATRAGHASGRARRAKSPSQAPPKPLLSPLETPHPGNFKDLTRTSVRNHQPPSDTLSERKSTDAARDPAQVGGSGPRASRRETTKERLARLAEAHRRKGQA